MSKLMITGFSMMLLIACSTSKPYYPIITKGGMIEAVETIYQGVEVNGKYFSGDEYMGNKTLWLFNENGSLKAIQSLNRDGTLNCNTRYEYNKKGIVNSASYCPEYIPGSRFEYVCSKGKIETETSSVGFDNDSKIHIIQTTNYFYEKDRNVHRKSYIDNRLVSTFDQSFEGDSIIYQVFKDSLSAITSTKLIKKNEYDDIVLIRDQDSEGNTTYLLEQFFEYDKKKNWTRKVMKREDDISIVQRSIVYKKAGVKN